jgi:hypothetical protein
MARYGWWRHYSRPTPDPLPATFESGPAQVVSTYFGPPSGGSRTYYRLVAVLFSVAGMETLTAQLYAMRVLSAVAALLALWCVWDGTRFLLGLRGATVVTAVMALHPQFIFVSTTASPDSLVNLAAAVVWRQAARLLTSPARALDVALLWLGATGGFALRRVGAPLLVLALLVTCAVAWRNRRETLSWRRLAAFGFGTLAAILVAAAVLPSELARAADGISLNVVHAFNSIRGRTGELPRFFEMLFRTFWVAAGWLRYSAPPVLHVATVALTAVAAAGLVKLIARREWRRPAVGLSAAAVAIQIIAIVVYHFGILQSGPQGRYMFPALPAVLCLLWLGWEAAVGGSGRSPVAAVSLVGVMAVLNTSAWLFVVMPAYV